MKTKRYFFCTEPDEMRYKVLADRARLFKKTEKGVRAMSGVLEEMREEVAERTAKKSAERIAIEMIKLGKLSDTEIASCSFLSVDEVKKLREGCRK